MHRNSKFGIQIEDGKYHPTDDNYPWKGRGQAHVTSYLNYGTPL